MQIYIAHKLQRCASVNANNINGPARLTVIKKREKTCSNGTCCTARARVGYLNRLNMNTALPVNPVVSSRSERIKSESFKWAHVRLAYFTTNYAHAYSHAYCILFILKQHNENLRLLESTEKSVCQRNEKKNLAFCDSSRVIRIFRA